MIVALNTLVSRLATFVRGPPRRPQAPISAGIPEGPRPLGGRALPPLVALPVLTAGELARLASLGIRPMELAGRLRLVLPVGCANDFTQTCAILRTGAAHAQADRAIQALIARGAHCDCTVFQAVGEPPRCAIWHP